MADLQPRQRRRARLLRYLAGAQHRGEHSLVRLFGTHVHGLLNELYRDGLAEYSLGDRPRWWLTAAGRNAAKPFLRERKAAA